MDIKSLTKTFDQSILRPEKISLEEIKKISLLAIEHGFRGIVIHPCNVSLVKNLLQGSSVLTVAVCDFPHGKGLTKSRVKDIKEILKLGVDEIDIVANNQYLTCGDIRSFKKDLKATAKAMGGKVLKIILEVDLLNEKQIKTATEVICKVANEENAKLVIKTKTGFVDTGVTQSRLSNLEAVKMIKTTLEKLNMYGEDKIRIKASGGIKTKEDAIGLIEAGANILGVSAPEQILGLIN